MHRIFAGLAAWIVGLFAAEFVLGWIIGAAVRRGDVAAAQPLFFWHMMGGIFLGTLSCVLHVMTMFHFIGSGREIKDAAEVLGEGNDLAARVRRFKAQTFPYATFAPIATGLAVILGGAAHMKKLPEGWGFLHWVAALAALGLNLAAFPIEYRALKGNLDLIHEVDERLRREVVPPLFRGGS